METLHTASEVLDELGGNIVVAALAGVKPKTVWHWRDTNEFPSNTYILITEALQAKRKKAPSSLWAMKAANSDTER